MRQTFFAPSPARALAVALCAFVISTDVTAQIAFDTRVHWSGLYIGLNIGGAFVPPGITRFAALPIFAAANSPITSNAAALSGSILLRDGNGAGLVGGGQIGYNFRLSSNLVAGVEADLQAFTTNSRRQFSSSASIDALSNAQAITTVGLEKITDYFGTVRGRLGYLLTPGLLAYGTGGFGFAGLGGSAELLQTVRQCANQTCQLLSGSIDPATPALHYEAAFSAPRTPHPGWTLGGGIEWLLYDAWSLRAEFLHYDFGRTYHNLGSLTVSDDEENPVVVSNPHAETRFKGNTFRLGVNYQLGEPSLVAPATADLHAGDGQKSPEKPRPEIISLSTGMFFDTRKTIEEDVGLTIAPLGLGASGPKVYIAGTNYGYYYDEQMDDNLRRRIHGHGVGAIGMVGYQVANPTSSAEFYVGLDYGHGTTYPDDPENHATGTGWGTAFSLTGSHQFDDVFSLSAEGDYSTKWRSYSVSLTPGVTIGNLTFGPEATYYGNNSYRGIMVGGYLDGIQMGPFSLNFHTGYFYDTYTKKGAYFSLGNTYKF
jgi:outer membrane immunogenic protein